MGGAGGGEGEGIGSGRLRVGISTVSVELLYRVVDPCLHAVCMYVSGLPFHAGQHAPFPSPPPDPAGQAREEEEAQMDYDSAMKEVLMHNPNGGARTDTHTTRTHLFPRVHTPPLLPT